MTKKITFVGDVHGKFGQMKTLLKDRENVIQVGDLGIGFKYFSEQEGMVKFSVNPPYDFMVKNNIRFIRGNHDNPDVCKGNSQWIKDGHTEEHNGVKFMFVGGAWSIDWQYRKEGFSWWKDEELSMEEFQSIIDKYVEYRPDVMITHDFPESAIMEIFIKGTHKPLYRSRTGQALDAMFKQHAPKLWIGGHWHERAVKELCGTKFLVLEELGIWSLEV